MKFAKNALIAGLAATTIAGGVLVFNTNAAVSVMNNIEALKSKIVSFAQNDAKLVDKYNNLKSDAEAKISDLEKQLESNSTTSKEEKDKLQEEIARLEGQLKLANAAIEGLEAQSNKAVKDVESLVPTSVNSLPDLNGNVTEEAKLAVTHFYSGRTQVDVNIKEDINIGLASKGNVVIKFTYADGTTETKNKVWDGYLNKDGVKYGLTNSKLSPGTYTTTVNNKETVKVEVTVTNNDGDVESITLNK